ncbi:MAG: VOC family protein [Vicinamibacterales bacterium]
MALPILGLHHVTATVDDAQADLDFCLEGLGLRLVKKTVNFDNHHVYHLYYGDERGTPGTIWTTFPYGNYGVPVGRKGAGQITVTSFSVPAGSLDRWKARLQAQGATVEDVAPRFGEESIIISDPSGLKFELVATNRDERTPWIAAGPEGPGNIDVGMAVRGIHSITMVVRSPVRTLEFMTGLLGYTVVNEIEGRIRMAVNGDLPGRTVDIVHDVNAPAAMNGLGTVHHMAMATATDDDQLRIRQELIRWGCPVTEVRDRCYFKSIYFHEPGGVLFEVATMTPGFMVDEPLPELGRALKLPPWEERYRKDIQAGLQAVTYRS